MKFNYDWFKHKDYSKVVWYKNPNECNQFNVERVNPDHIGILWGRRKRGSKGRNWIQVAKIYFSIIPVVYGLSVVSWLDAFTGYIYNILGSIGLFSIVVYTVVGILIYLPMFKKEMILCQVNGGVS